MYFRFNIQKFKILLLPIILEKRHIIELLIHAGIFLQSYLFKEVIFIISQKLVLSKPWLNGKEHVRKLALGSCYLKHCLVQNTHLKEMKSLHQRLHPKAYFSAIPSNQVGSTEVHQKLVNGEGKCGILLNGKYEPFFLISHNS